MTKTVSGIARFFSDVHAQMAPMVATSVSDAGRRRVSKSDLKPFFATISHRVDRAEARQRLINKTEATGFNVFEWIAPDENKLSDILAWLIDPDGSHGQGDLFLRSLLERLGFQLVDDHGMRRRSYYGHRRRIGRSRKSCGGFTMTRHSLRMSPSNYWRWRQPANGLLTG